VIDVAIGNSRAGARAFYAAEKDIERVQRAIKDIREIDIRNASRMAFNRAGRMAVTRARRLVSVRANLPQKVLKKRFGLSKATKKHPFSIAVFLRYRGVSAGSLNLRGIKAGVRAGKHFFPGAWGFGAGYVTKEEGFHFQSPIVFARKSRARDSYEAQRIPLLPYVSEVRARVDRIVPLIYRKRFTHEIERRIKRRIKKRG